MASKKQNPVYAHIRASVEYNYGHINVHCYELFGWNGPTLKISCQTGGSEKSVSYAWQHGLSDDFSVIGMNACRLGYLLLRKISKRLKEVEDEHGSPTSFADYAVRVLQAAGIRRVYMTPGINGSISGAITDLPCADPRKDGDSLRAGLLALEESLVSRTAR